MMEYISFLCKRMLRRKSCFVLILFSLVIVCVFLVMNVRTQNGFGSKMESQIKSELKFIKSNEIKMNDLNESSIEYLSYQESNQKALNRIKMCKETLAFIDKKNIAAAYDSYCKVLEEQILMAENSEVLSDMDHKADLSNGINKELVYIKYLQKHQLAYEVPEFPITGLSFTTSMSQILLPIIIACCCIYILVQLYTLDYIKGQDISVLYPMSKVKKIFINLVMGVIISVGVFTILLLSSFLLATLITGKSGLNYPIMLQNVANGTWNTVSMLSFFKDWVVLGVLFSISLSIFIYIVSLFIREDMYLFLIITTLVLGFYYLPNVVSEFQIIAHNIPTTYMSFVDVANGTLASHFSNINITTSKGVSILTISIVVQLLICCFLHGIEKIRRVKG